MKSLQAGIWLQAFTRLEGVLSLSPGFWYCLTGMSRRLRSRSRPPATGAPPRLIPLGAARINVWPIVSQALRSTLSMNLNIPLFVQMLFYLLRVFFMLLGLINYIHISDMHLSFILMNFKSFQF